MKTAYFDAFSGLSGDMIVGALIDAGTDFGSLQDAIGSLELHGYELAIRAKSAGGIVGTKFEVMVQEEQPERHLHEIIRIIERGRLNDHAKSDAIRIFENLAEAEAHVHRTTPDRVHFHEVGAVDSIIDIVATAWAVDQLGIGEILVSSLPMGSGFVKSRHGVIPVPPPAVVELLSGFQVRIGDGASEMVTPTGAAIVKTLAQPSPVPLNFKIAKIAYGAGTKDFADRPNLLRLMLGERAASFETDELIAIEANIDDLNPQIFDHVSDRLFAAGARDVTITPTIMKKSRPGVVLAVLAELVNREVIAKILFAETSTIGLRTYPVSRLKLPRRTIDVETRFGTIRVKVSGEPGNSPTVSPEYEDCRRAACANDAPLKVIIEEAVAIARRMLS
jgi:uncharacterized protein (TIGR00299 family) protein